MQASHYYHNIKDMWKYFAGNASKLVLKSLNHNNIIFTFTVLSIDVVN